MRRIARVLGRIDSFLSWWERLVPSSWNKALVGVVTAYLFTYWAALTEQAGVVIAACGLGAVASAVILFTYLPPLLKKSLSPPLMVVTHPSTLSSQGGALPIFVVNRSPRSRVHLEFLLHIPLSDGTEVRALLHWFPGQGFTPRLGPGESTGGRLHCTSLPQQDRGAYLYDKAYLRVVDYVSARSLTVGIPGGFPPEEFDPERGTTT